MSTISAVTNSYASTDSSSTTTTSTKSAQQSLGQEDFLKLLAQQYQNQDPMDPMDDTTFIANMAQFTSLEQTSEISETLATMKDQQSLATANSYIGHTVTVDAGDDETATGAVTGVKMVDGEPQLVIGEKTYALSSVTLVEPTAVTNASGE